MSIDTRHPDYLEVEDDYRVMRDTFAGQRRIKEASFLYLPPTTGQVKDGALNSIASPGWTSYTNYLTRAVFPEFVKDAVNTLVGVMHAEAPIIELPEELEPMRLHASRKGETLAMLLRRVNEQQLLYGRFGLLADFPQDPEAAARAETPHLVTYQAETVINWDDERFTEYGSDRLNFAVFNETVFVRGAAGANVFDYQKQRRYRVVFLEPEDPEQPETPTNPLVYKTYTEADEIRSETVTPQFRGTALNDIPFVFIGANDLNPEPDEIPLLGLANLSLTVYRGEADYRQSLHMQGQDTLVIIGDEITAGGDVKDEDAETEVGAGAIIRIAAGEGAGAQFIGVDSRGLPEQRQAIDADRSRAQSMGARLLEPRGSQAESGEALRIRVAASTATLSTIALTAAAALKHSARWIGANPDEVKVRPNMDFTQESPSPELARELGEAVKTGSIPLSMQAIHKWLQAKNFTKFTFEEEQRLLQSDAARKAAEDLAEKIAGRTESDATYGDHAHSYMLLRFPDGSVFGVTDVVNGHFHVIREEGITQSKDGHQHRLLEGQPIEQMTNKEEEEEEDDSSRVPTEDEQGSETQE